MIMDTEQKYRTLRLALVIGGALVMGWIAYFGLRDGMPMWAIAAAAAIILFFIVLVWRDRRPQDDERLASILVASGRARTVPATVVSVTRLGTRETEELRETLLGLTLTLADGQAARIEIASEDALLASFSTGKTVQVLQASDDPGRVALDRRVTPTRVR